MPPGSLMATGDRAPPYARLPGVVPARQATERDSVTSRRRQERDMKMAEIGPHRPADGCGDVARADVRSSAGAARLRRSGPSRRPCVAFRPWRERAWPMPAFSPALRVWRARGPVMARRRGRVPSGTAGRFSPPCGLPPTKQRTVACARCPLSPSNLASARLSNCYFWPCSILWVALFERFA